MSFDLDGLDEKILRLFQENGRRSNRSVAHELGISEGAVRKRINKLEKDEAIVYGLIVDVEAYGTSVWSWLIIDVAPAHADQIAEFVGLSPFCTMCSITTENFGIRAAVFAKDRSGLVEIVNLVSSRPGVLSVVAREIVSHAHHKHNLTLPSEVWGEDS